MARPRSPDFDTQRATILHVAARLFAEQGFPSASTASIAKACGFSKPLLYHYYRDKEHILVDIVNGYLDRLIGIVAEVRARKLPPEVQFRELVARFMEEYQHSQAQHMVLVQDVKYLTEAQHAQAIAKQREVVAAFAQVIAKLNPRWNRRNLRVPLTMILFGMINWTFTWLRPEGALSYHDMAKVVSDVFLHGVLPVPLLEERSA